LTHSVTETTTTKNVQELYEKKVIGNRRVTEERQNLLHLPY